MKKYLFLLPLLGMGLSSCDTIRAMERNRQAIDCSTRSICENIRAIEEANRAIDQNRRQLEEINASLKSVGES